MPLHCSSEVVVLLRVYSRHPTVPTAPKTPPDMLSAHLGPALLLLGVQADVAGRQAHQPLQGVLADNLQWGRGEPG